MSLSKDQTPGAAKAKPTTAGRPGTATPLQSEANPEGKPGVSTGPVGASEVIEGQEHVLGDDPRRVSIGFHDSLTGAPVTESGEFIEPGRKGTGPVPKHRIVADNWPQEREQGDSATRREGNEAV